MEEGISTIVSFLVSLGLPGVLIIGGAYWIKVVTDRNYALTDKVIELGNKQAEQNAATLAALQQLQNSLLLLGKGAG